MTWSHYPSFLNLEVQLSEIGLPSRPTTQKALLAMFGVDNSGKMLKDTMAAFAAAKAQAAASVPAARVSKDHAMPAKPPLTVFKGRRKASAVKGLTPCRDAADGDDEDDGDGGDAADAADDQDKDKGGQDGGGDQGTGPGTDSDGNSNADDEDHDQEGEDQDSDSAGELGPSRGRHDRLTLAQRAERREDRKLTQERHLRNLYSEWNDTVQILIASKGPMSPTDFDRAPPSFYKPWKRVSNLSTELPTSRMRGRGLLPFTTFEWWDFASTFSFKRHMGTYAAILIFESAAIVSYRYDLILCRPNAGAAVIRRSTQEVLVSFLVDKDLDQTAPIMLHQLSLEEAFGATPVDTTSQPTQPATQSQSCSNPPCSPRPTPSLVCEGNLPPPACITWPDGIYCTTFMDDVRAHNLDDQVKALKRERQLGAQEREAQRVVNVIQGMKIAWHDPDTVSIKKKAKPPIDGDVLDALETLLSVRPSFSFFFMLVFSFSLPRSSSFPPQALNRNAYRQRLNSRRSNIDLSPASLPENMLHVAIRNGDIDDDDQHIPRPTVATDSPFLLESRADAERHLRRLVQAYVAAHPPRHQVQPQLTVGGGRATDRDIGPLDNNTADHARSDPPAGSKSNDNSEGSGSGDTVDQTQRGDLTTTNTINANVNGADVDMGPATDDTSQPRPANSAGSDSRSPVPIMMDCDEYGVPPPSELDCDIDCHTEDEFPALFEDHAVTSDGQFISDVDARQGEYLFILSAAREFIPSTLANPTCVLEANKHNPDIDMQGATSPSVVPPVVVVVTPSGPAQPMKRSRAPSTSSMSSPDDTSITVVARRTPTASESLSLLSRFSPFSLPSLRETP